MAQASRASKNLIYKKVGKSKYASDYMSDSAMEHPSVKGKKTPDPQYGTGTMKDLGMNPEMLGLPMMKKGKKKK